MTKAQEEALYQANIRLTVLYLLPDVCETIMKDFLDYRKKAGAGGLKFEQKRAWNALFKNVTTLRETMKIHSEDVQASYGDVCDVLHDLIMLAIDRCGERDFQTMLRFIDYIQSFPSKRNIEIK